MESVFPSSEGMAIEVDSAFLLIPSSCVTERRGDTLESEVFSNLRDSYKQTDWDWNEQISIPLTVSAVAAAADVSNDLRWTFLV